MMKLVLNVCNSSFPSVSVSVNGIWEMVKYSANYRLFV